MTTLPFRAIDAWRILDEAAPDFFEGPDDRVLCASRGWCVRIEKFIKVWPEKTQWETLGAFIQAGGVRYAIDRLGPAWMASSQLAVNMSAALAWDQAGRPDPIMERQRRRDKLNGFSSGLRKARP